MLRQIDVGDGTSFTIWIFARPLPRADQWHWTFSGRNYSGMQRTEPSDVELKVSGNVATLIIGRVTNRHYGNYSIWTANAYGGWKEGELTFILVPKGKIDDTSLYVCFHRVRRVVLFAMLSFYVQRCFSVRSCKKDEHLFVGKLLDDDLWPAWLLHRIELRHFPFLNRSA